MDVKSEREIRKLWGVGDKVEVFSKSKQQWFPAKIIEIYTDEDGEWLAVVVAETMVKEVQRFNTDVRPLSQATDSDVSDSDTDVSSVDSNSDSDSIIESSLDSNDDEEKLDKAKHRKKRDKKLAKKMQRVVIYVERAGTSVCNGKYMYSTTKNGYPVFANIDDETEVTIWFDSDNEQWIFTRKTTKLYWADGYQTEVPPSKGWTRLKGEFPVPGVRLDKLVLDKGKDTFFEDDPYKFSPFDMLKCVFNGKEKLGFELELIKAHNQFVAIKSLTEDGQAEKKGLLPGDIIVSVSDEDLSTIKSIKDVQETIEEIVSIVKSKTKGSGEIPEIHFTFAREKKTFKVMLVQRAGTAEVNGKYTISGTENGALKFVRNDDPSYTICRIYVSEDPDEDEAIWALRKNKEDYYIILAGAKDEVPPECGWEAVEPLGFWPAPGLTYYDVDIVPPPKPIITKTQPNPNAVQLHWKCDGERRPKVCPHMEVWYEVECRHIYGQHKEWKGFNTKNNHNNQNKKHDENGKNTGTGTSNGKGVRFDVGENGNDDYGNDILSPHLHREKHTRIIKVTDGPIVVDKLINGEEYIFTVRSCNQVSSSTSNETEKIIPLRLPPKPRIRNIKGYPGELFVTFTCPRAKDKEVNGKYQVIVDPPIPLKHQIHKKDENGLLIVDDDSLPIRLRGLTNGTNYQIIIACVNNVGITYSEPETAYPSKAPPQPEIKEVIAGNREITIKFECNGYDASDVRAWFEVDIDPEPPQLISTLDKKMSKKDDMEMTYTDDEKSSTKTPKTPRSRLRRKKSRWAKFNSYGDDEDDENFIPLFRRAKRYLSSPIKISPLKNGESYCVRVKAVTLTAQKITAFSEIVIPSGPPPKPKIIKVQAKESSAEVYFDCDDYATEEYKAKYQIESRPTTLTMKNVTKSPVLFKGLRNGVNYKFSVRGVNKVGKSQWSDNSQHVTPLMRPPEPISIQTIPYDREVTLFWVCEELNQPQYQGWYEIKSDPPTFNMVVHRQKTTFKRLTNGVSYKFQVSAVNQVDRCDSQWSKSCAPSLKLNQKQYLREKKRAAVLCREQVLEQRKKRKQQQTQQHMEKVKKRMRAVQNLEDKKKRNVVARKIEKKKKRENNRKQKEDKKSMEREKRKQRMFDQRKKVLQNKRRMSLLHRERINNLQQQWNNRGKNTNTAMSMMSKKKKNGKKTNLSPKKKKNGRQPSGKFLKNNGKKSPRSSSTKRTSSSPKKNNNNSKLSTNGNNSTRNSTNRKSTGKKSKKIEELMD